jgi:hypothetical protein
VIDNHIVYLMEVMIIEYIWNGTRLE